MKLDDAIRWNIYNYPTLFRANDYETSRIYVLGHMFLCIGTGLEWHKDGFLAPMNSKGYNLSQVRKTLPKNYFKKNLYTIDVLNENIEEMKNEFKNRFYYLTKKDRFDRRTRTVIYEVASEDEALEIRHKFDFDKFCSIEGKNRKFNYVLEANNKSSRYINKTEKINIDFYNLYPIGEYSALVEIMDGKTRSLHIDNFDLPEIPLDWFEGAIDIARYAQSYYNDPKKYSMNFYYPTYSTLTYELEKAIKENREEKFRKQFGMENGKTPKERAEESWKHFHAEQLDILNRFLEKFSTVYISRVQKLYTENY